MKNRSGCVVSTWTSDSISISTTAAEMMGMLITAGTDLATVTVKDGAATKFVFAVATGSSLPIAFCTPIEFSSNLTVTNSGTGSYSVMFGKRI